MDTSQSLVALNTKIKNNTAQMATLNEQTYMLQQEVATLSIQDASERLIILRLTKRWSRKELARRSGISDYRIVKLEELPHTITGPEVIHLARVFNVSCDFILGVK